jgi:hypothetical protein
MNRERWWAKEKQNKQTNKHLKQIPGSRTIEFQS